ncbi:MAG: hypothetical protein QNJ65_08465, partial [Xenococcaceae cyanobacterium MO_234.B1]|nr:hypothetical protein [Xenococcaceae cyanobacterium MO_234.B1]
VFLSLPLGFKTPVQAQSNQDCSLALNQVAEQIYNYGTSINVSAYNTANDGYIGNPSQRNGMITFLLGNPIYQNKNSVLFLENSSTKSDSIAANILNSQQLQQDWANHLVKNCNNLAVVTFAKAYSGWSNQYAIQTNGLTAPRECLDPAMGSGKFLPWNYTYCT